MKIGELAQLSGLTVETIRYYEQQGLLAKAARADSNYRVYQAPHLETLLFIKQCRSLDLSLLDIRQLLVFKKNPNLLCGGVNELVERQLLCINQKISDLQSLETQLTALREQCHTVQSAAECGILNGLSGAALHVI